MEARTWLREWFGRRGPVPEPRADYFETGALDSLAVVELVADIEKSFRVRFEDKHYQERRFSTLDGLADLIAELAAPKVP
ncbi:MAG: acyl carrier protein [Elusimicrobia bacterium]|nr:acyl carrier protein [Elusimicrobiota bacterium]